MFVAIGASGSEGLDDIKAILQGLRRPVKAIVMVVLHRPSDKVSNLRDILARACDLDIVIADEAEILTEGVCYIGEPAGHLTLVDTHIAHLVPGHGHSMRNRTIDALFASLASHAGPRAIGVILSGALQDGSKGLAAIHAADGVTMVLDPHGKPRGMQQNAVDYDGPINFIGDREEIVGRIERILAS